MCNLILALTAVVAASGCVSHSTVSPESVTPNSELRLRFEPPKEVTLRTEEGDILVLERVSEMRGRFLVANGDSLVFRTTRAEYDGGRTSRFGRGAIAYIARDEVTMDAIESNHAGTIVFVAALGLLVALVVAISTPTEHVPAPKQTTK
jgi:hypothetical protein